MVWLLKGSSKLSCYSGNNSDVDKGYSNAITGIFIFPWLCWVVHYMCCLQLSHHHWHTRKELQNQETKGLPLEEASYVIWSGRQHITKCPTSIVNTLPIPRQGCKQGGQGPASCLITTHRHPLRKHLSPINIFWIPQAPHVLSWSNRFSMER